MTTANCTPYAILLGSLLLGASCVGGLPERGSQRDLGSVGWDGAVVFGSREAAPPDGEPAPKVDQGQVCPFGNLFDGLPALPPLCRPFAPPAPTPPPPDPPGCQQGTQVVLTAGSDTFVGMDSVKDIVLGMDGDDVIKGMGCSDEINGNVGNDQVNGNMGNDIVQGGQGNDILHGGADNDQITGGGGDDQLHGDLGDDEYYFSEADGHDVIEETGGYDRLICAPIYGRPAARLLGWQRAGDDLVLHLSGSSSVQVKGYFANPAASIDAIVGC